MYSIYYGIEGASPSINDVGRYVVSRELTRSYLQHTSGIHTPMGNSNIRGIFVPYGCLHKV
jgi:hypothetical protein